MRLYLSSYRLGAHPERFAEQVGGSRTGRVVQNALDAGDEPRRRRDLDRQIAALASIGLVGTDLDLREHDPSTIGAELAGADFLWVRGGNVFVLRAAMAASGLDALVVEGLRADAFVYAGFSAGACVLAPSLDGLERCDPVEPARKRYGTVITAGLGVLDRPVVPHLDSPGHPETGLLAEVAARYDRIGRPYWALRDGQALVPGPRGLTVV